MQLERIPPYVPTPPPPAPPPPLVDPEIERLGPIQLDIDPQKAFDRLLAHVPQLNEAVARLHAAVDVDRADPAALYAIAKLGQGIHDDISMLHGGRLAQPELRNRLAHIFAGHLARSMSAFQVGWSVPGSAMKPLANVERGAVMLAAKAADPSSNLSGSLDGQGLNLISNGLRTLGSLPPVEGPAYRVLGVTRMVHDAILRIEDGMRSASPQFQFRSSIQGGVASAHLREALATGARLLPSPIIDALTSALSAAAPTFDPGGRDFPRGIDSYLTGMRGLKDAAGAALEVLDAASKPLLEVGGDEGRLRADWRAVQRVPERGPYHDPDIGW